MSFIGSGVGSESEQETFGQKEVWKLFFLLLFALKTVCAGREIDSD
jgi:hypothetical protein